MSDLSRKGILVPGNRITVAAALTTTLLATISTGRRAIIKKITGFNNTGADCSLLIGNTSTGLVTGVFTQQLVTIRLINGQYTNLDKNDIVAFEFPAAGNIFCQSSAFPVDVQVELEEFGG